MENNYKDLLRQILHEGELRSNRTNTRAKSLFGLNLRFNIQNYFPLLTSKFIDFDIIQTEFEWFIKGHTTTKLFKDRGISIWDAWADAEGNLGPVYGYQMLNFNGKNYNQLNDLLKALKDHPNSRRHIISLWNPQQLNDMALPPCYLYFQFYIEENSRLNMFVVQRSGDMFAGIPYDIGVFSHFLIYIAKEVGLIPNIISVNIVDAHIYEDHIPGAMLYLSRPEFEQPTWLYDNNKIKILNYNHLSKIKIKIAV